MQYLCALCLKMREVQFGAFCLKIREPFLNGKSATFPELIISKISETEQLRNASARPSDEIGVILQSGGKVVSDRYWLTTHTYHQVMGIMNPYTGQ